MQAILRHPFSIFVIAILNKIKNPDVKSFIVFFLTAVLGASVNFFSQIFYRDFSSLEWSIFWGYSTATLVSYIPQKIFAFEAKSTLNTNREMIKYGIIAFGALGIQILVTKFTFSVIINPILADSLALKLQEKIGHVFGMGCSFLVNFFGHKFLTFRSTGIYDKVQERRKL